MLLDGMNVFSRVIKVNMARGGTGPGLVRSNDPDRVQRTIHIGGLPFDEISEETLADYFSHVGEVSHVPHSSPPNFLVSLDEISKDSLRSTSLMLGRRLLS
jgi:RNA recognition motif-containing protein